MRKRELHQIALSVGGAILCVYALITHEPLAAVAALVPASCALCVGGADNG